MPSSRSTNTMAEFLQRMLGDIAEAKTLPDANLEFLIKLETDILQTLRAPIDALMGQMEGAGGAAGAGAGGIPGMGGAGMPPVPMMPGGGPMPVGAGRVPGTRNDMGPINPDELLRTIGGANSRG